MERDGKPIRETVPQPGEPGYLEHQILQSYRTALLTVYEALWGEQAEGKVKELALARAAREVQRMATKEQIANLLLPLAERLVEKLESGEPISQWGPGLKAEFKDAVQRAKAL